MHNAIKYVKSQLIIGVVSRRTTFQRTYIQHE